MRFFFTFETVGAWRANISPEALCLLLHRVYRESRRKRPYYVLVCVWNLRANLLYSKCLWWFRFTVETVVDYLYLSLCVCIKNIMGVRNENHQSESYWKFYFVYFVEFKIFCLWFWSGVDKTYFAKFSIVAGEILCETDGTTLVYYI